MDILTKDNLLAFARSKPPHDGFNYLSNGMCAIAQFLESELGQPMNIGGFDYQYLGTRYDIPQDILAAFGEDPLPLMAWGTLAECLEHNMEMPQCDREL